MVTIDNIIILYGRLSKSDENSLAVWERKTMRRIYGPVKKKNGVWRIRTDKDFIWIC